MNNAKYIRRGVIKQVLPLFLVALSVLMSSCKIVASYDVSDKKSEKSTASYSVKDVNIPKAPTSKEEKESLYMPQALLDELPDDDFGEMYFTVITLAGKNLVFPEEASYIAPALYERNKKVEEKYNIKLYEKAIGENEIIEYLSSGELSGSYYADLIDLPYEYMPLLYEKGLIQDFSTKPFFVENRPYFDFEISDMLNSGYDGLYALYSDALYSPDDMYCLLYNKEAQGAKALEESGFSAPLAQSCGLVCDKDLPLELAPLCTGNDISMFENGEALMCIDRICAIQELSGKMSLGVMALPLDEGKNAYMPESQLQVFFYPSRASSDKCTCLVASALGAAGYDLNVKSAKEYYMAYVQDNSSALMLDKIFARYKTRDLPIVN